MARLASSHPFDSTEMTALRPSLRAALRLAREYGSFSPILKGIGEGDTIILSRLFGECGLSLAALADFFLIPGRSLTARIVELQPIAIDLVFDLMGVDPDEKSETKPADPKAKPFDYAKHFEGLFGFATGILRWTPDDAWNAAPGEIMAAWHFRSEAYASPEERKQKEVAALSLADRARLTFATLGTRTETNAD